MFAALRPFKTTTRKFGAGDPVSADDLVGCDVNALVGKTIVHAGGVVSDLAGSTQVVINNHASVNVQAERSTGPLGPRIEVMISGAPPLKRAKKADAETGLSSED